MHRGSVYVSARRRRERRDIVSACEEGKDRSVGGDQEMGAGPVGRLGNQGNRMLWRKQEGVIVSAGPCYGRAESIAAGELLYTAPLHIYVYTASCRFVTLVFQL